MIFRLISSLQTWKLTWNPRKLTSRLEFCPWSQFSRFTGQFQAPSVENGLQIRKNLLEGLKCVFQVTLYDFQTNFKSPYLKIDLKFMKIDLKAEDLSLKSVFKVYRSVSSFQSWKLTSNPWKFSWRLKMCLSSHFLWFSD